MPKKSKKVRIKNRYSGYKTAIAQPAQIIIKKPQETTQAYDASSYIKKDLKWTAVVGGIVTLILILVYIFLH